jgi:hypothetical protein
MGFALFRNRFLFPALTLFLGLALGGMFPHTPIHAVATDRTESFLVATGMVDSEVEAIYLLDCLTGDLRGAVLGKARGGFTAIFAYPGAKLLQDFGLDPSKNPKFLMVTGLADLRTGAQTTFGASVVYVVELTSGKVGAYAIPWNRTMWNTRTVVSEPMIPVGMLPFRAPPPQGPAPKIGGTKAKEKEKEKEKEKDKEKEN